MPEFSNLLRERLATGTPADPHPDADTLTAFAEKLLPLGEQNRVLEHIAFCSQCREVIVLSQGALSAEPAVAYTGQAVAAPARTGRRLWAPLFGLAASTAALAVVAVLMVRTPQHPGTATFTEQTKQEAKAALPPPAASAASDVSAPTSDSSLSQAPKAGLQDSLRGKATASASTGSLRPSGTETYANPGFMARNEAAPAPPVIGGNTSSSLSAITDSVAPRSRRDYLNDRALTANQNQSVPTVAEIPGTAGGRVYSSQFGNTFVNSSQLNLSELPADLPSGSQAQGVQGREVGTTALGSPQRHFPLFGQVKQQVTREVARFRIPIGKPDQNTMFSAFNAGEKTQSFEISAAPSARGASELDQTKAFTASAMKRSSAAAAAPAPPTWVVRDGKLLRTGDSGSSIAGYAAGDIEFTTVTARGTDVWAGGHRAALIHSRDGGASWERVRLAESANGTIKSIFAVGQNVQVTTAEGQSWQSQDGGRTWVQN